MGAAKPRKCKDNVSKAESQVFTIKIDKLRGGYKKNIRNGCYRSTRRLLRLS